MLIFSGGGGRKPPIWWNYMWPAIPIFELGRAILVKSHVWRFGSNLLRLSRVIVSTKKKKKRVWGGGLYLTCDTHSRTRQTYSSQKSCVKIWFGLAEIGGMLIGLFRGVQKPPIRWIICDLRYTFSNTAELFQSKVMCENLVRIGWAFQELSW